RFRVLSDFTALLVLETEADYQRFHIDRRALSDILTVGATGLEVQNRRSAPPVALQQAAEPMVVDRLITTSANKGTTLMPQNFAPSADVSGAPPASWSRPMPLSENMAMDTKARPRVAEPPPPPPVIPPASSINNPAPSPATGGDTDRDGIADVEDRCPYEPGPRE